MRLSDRIKLDGGEWDAFCKRSRRLIVWDRGEVTFIKRRFRKRLRRMVKASLAPGKREPD